eukprot:SAG22_NODE_1577_length_4074_cov_1.659371_2_plen_120_part_00
MPTVVQADSHAALLRLCAPSGFFAAAAGRPNACLALLIDCHFEVEEEVVISNATTGEVVRTESHQRDHIWTFMMTLDGGLTSDDAAPDFVVRDMNHFVSAAGIVSDTTKSHLGVVTKKE